ncbi:glycoside hydrolase family 61 protein [Amylocarpus encephaloides]|uniref:AA9 family lytic polysaccharide monooxygenase n=1 Tax=Amylocarpus encephaloides TaxID=45428 RepID=A0A9P7YRU4_9HELO|nr:glycoside hydrolase family 61 protein [Amylocarpus encephaloides]
MQISKITSALVALQTVAAHTVFTTLLINDVNQGDGTCVRMPLNPPTATAPVNDLASNDMVCGFDGTNGVARVCPAPKGAKLSFTYRLYPDGSQPGALDPNHKGPCAVYMKHVESAINDTGVGDGWFKVWEEGYDEGKRQWCTEKLIHNDGILSVKIPDGLAGGYYLVRPEVLSLHESDKTPANPQFYVGCAQVFLDAPATTLPKDTVSIPGYVKISDPEVLFNIYTPKFPYKPPGPAVYQPGVSASKEIAATAKPTEEQIPKGVVLTNANWMGIEVPQFSTADGCDQAAEDCWAQSKVCFDTAPPTGSANCKIWEAKCEGIRSTCKNPAAGVPSMGKAPTQDPSPPATASSSTAPEPKVNVAQVKSAPGSTPSLPVSRSGGCGSSTLGETCKGSVFGDCCSEHGYCGKMPSYCGLGCQKDFGECRKSKRDGRFIVR